jgi:hypothetical protein
MTAELNTRPTIWIGDLQDLPAGTFVEDFWERFSPTGAYIELADEAEEYVAVVVDRHLMAVRCANDGELIWAHDRALLGNDKDAFEAGIQASDLFDNRLRGTSWFR